MVFVARMRRGRGTGNPHGGSSLPQLIAWEPEHEDEATVVTVRPNFQDSVHVGYVAGLRKFAEYFTSVLCFTTPGDGPRSPPQLVRTHEDGTGRLRLPRDGPCPPPRLRPAAEPRGAPSKGRPLPARSSRGSRGCRGLLHVGAESGCLWAVPGPVGHLSFSDILDTSLKVSWQEPLEKNGILTGKGPPAGVGSIVGPLPTPQHLPFPCPIPTLQHLPFVPSHATASLTCPFPPPQHLPSVLSSSHSAASPACPVPPLSPLSPPGWVTGGGDTGVHSRVPHLMGGVQPHQHAGDALPAQRHPGVPRHRPHRPHHLHHRGGRHDLQGTGTGLVLHHLLRGPPR